MHTSQHRDSRNMKKQSTLIAAKELNPWPTEFIDGDGKISLTNSIDNLREHKHTDEQNRKIYTEPKEESQLREGESAKWLHLTL